MSKHVLVLDARFYDEIADELVKGASEELDAHGYTYDRVSVPGVFELAGAVNFAIHSNKYTGYVVLGCVIRGETTHYDYVCQENARGLTNLTLEKNVAIGYGVITVENKAQAMVRAEVKQNNKGRDAAIACIEMINIKQHFAKN